MQLWFAKNIEMPQQKCQVLSLLLAPKIREMGCGQPEGEETILKKLV